MEVGSPQKNIFTPEASVRVSATFSNIRWFIRPSSHLPMQRPRYDGGRQLGVEQEASPA